MKPFFIENECLLLTPGTFLINTFFEKTVHSFIKSCVQRFPLEQFPWTAAYWSDRRKHREGRSSKKGAKSVRTYREVISRDVTR